MVPTGSHEGIFIYFFYRRHTNRNKKERNRPLQLADQEIDQYSMFRARSSKFAYYMLRMSVDKKIKNRSPADETNLKKIIFNLLDVKNVSTFFFLPEIHFL